ncbi:MAG TPA: ABC transporter permease [Thermoplasmata archaeon]|nr:ABC transporter permease [Thermoplasmata archaeon]
MTVATPTVPSGLSHRLRLNLKAVVGRAYPRVIGANREPSWVIFEAVLPLLGIAAFVFIYQALANRALLNPALTEAQRAAIIAATNALIGFVVLGGTMTAFWLNVLWSMASQLYWEKEIGNLQLYMMAPMSRMALLGGMAVGGMFMTSVRAMTTLVVGVVVFSVVIQVTNPFLLLAVFFVTLIALYGMGMALASLYLLWGREAWHLSALLEEPIYFASGFNFPAGGFARMGGWGRAVLTFATFIPATVGLDAMRQMMFPGGGSLPIDAFGVMLTPEIELGILIVLAVAFLFLARYALAYLEMLARREGRLTSRHQ